MTMHMGADCSSATSATSEDTLLVCFPLLDMLLAIAAGTVTSSNIINAKLSKLSGTENHVLFQQLLETKKGIILIF